MFDDFQDMDDGNEDDVFSAYEPDEPEGLLPARESALCLGHDAIEKKLLTLINSGAMPHAIIFSGPKGIGKATMAFRLARYMLKSGPIDAGQDSLFGGDTPAEAKSLDIPADDPVFSKVTSGGHPDMLTIERQMDARKGTRKSNLDVDTARKVAPFLRMTSADGGWRVVVIDDADTMNRNAQNAMLKILEEPPKNALLILVTHRLGAMIPTIRSRCRVINFEPLAPEDMTTLLSKEIGNTLSEAQKNTLNAMAGGSIGQAQKIIESGGLEITEQVIELMSKHPNYDWISIHHLADQAGRMGQDTAFDNIERTFLWIIESFIFAQASPQNMLPTSLTEAKLAVLMNATPLQDWLKIFEGLRAHFTRVKHSNLDKRQGVIGAFQILSAQ